jgi:hypothetical protein
MLFTLVRSAAQLLFSATIGRLAHEIGLGDLIEGELHELGEVDLGGCGQKATEALRSAGDGVLGFISNGAKHLANTAPDGPPAEPR